MKIDEDTNGFVDESTLKSLMKVNIIPDKAAVREQKENSQSTIQKLTLPLTSRVGHICC